MVACGDSALVPLENPFVDAGTPGEDQDAETVDASPAKDAGRDAAKPDASRADSGNDASTGPIPLDESCGYGPVASPDGTAIAFVRCNSPRSLVIRNFVSNTATVLGTDATYWRSPLAQGLLSYVGGQTRLFGWDGAPKYALPGYVADTDTWRVRVSATDMRYARQEAVATTTGTHDERFAFLLSGSGTPVLSAPFTAQYPTVPSVVLSEDGTYAASIERYSSGLTSRLRVAQVAAGAAVTTYELSYFEPRWVPRGVVGNGALFTSQRYLYFADFTTGAVTKVSTLPVVPSTSQPDRVYAAVSGPYVFFVDGVMRQNGSGALGSFTLKRWDTRTPAALPVTHATGTDYVSAYADVPMTVLPDGVSLAYAMEPPSVIAGTSYHVVPVAGGADRIFAQNRAGFGPAALATWSDYSRLTHFENLADGTSRTFVQPTTGYHSPFLGADGASLFVFTVSKNDAAKTAAVKLEAAGFTGTPKTLLDLPASSKLYNIALYSAPHTYDDAAPLTDGMVVRIPRGTPDGAGDLFVYRR